MAGISIVKRLSAFAFSTGAVLVLVLATQPPALPDGMQQSSTGANTTSPTSTEANETTKDTVQNKVSAAPIGQNTRYLVEPGDTLSQIALTYRVSVNQLKQANNLSTDKLSIGQELSIPFSAAAPSAKQTQIKTVTDKRSATPASTPIPSRSKAAVSGRVGEMVTWSKAQQIFAVSETALLTDVDTGETFTIKRKGGHNHADCEPLTSADTLIMKKIYKTWSWNRRAVVVVTDGQKIAASMAGMPHGSQTIADNNFPGHFDLHFLGSMTHGSSYTKTGIPLVDPDHQAMVRKAAGR